MADTECETFLAMDVGGTNITLGLVDQYGQLLVSRRFSTRAQRPPAELIDDMIKQLKTMAGEAPHGRVPKALGFGMPGWLKPEEGVLVRAPNMPGWNNIPIAEILSEALQIPAYLENDGNLYGLGEWRYGAGQGLENIMVATLGTGVGGALILKNELWHGSFASATEIGHLPAEPNGSLCGCGRRGCLETLASATGISRQGREWLQSGRKSAYKGAPEDLTAKIMCELAAEGDEMALAVFENAGQALGMIFAGILNLLGLQGIIIGGGVAGAFKFMEPAAKRIIAERVIIAEADEIIIKTGFLGDKAPLAGVAAMMAARGNTF